jgi:DNA-binding GntR family transcriptional regulator
VTGNNDTPTRIPRATFASMVGERIRSAIIDGTMPPGSQLNEVELAAMFGVSRGPVREAIQRLVQEGLLRSEPHHGVFVPVMSEADINDIYLAREALETAAIRKIMGESRSASAYKSLDRLVRKMRDAEAADDWRAVANLDLEFHTELVSAAGSPRLERMFTTIISETRLCLSVLTDAFDRRDDTVDEHWKISEMMRENDTDGAVAAMKKHFDDAKFTLKRDAGPASGATAQ